jgi:hypothetical protein
MMNTYYLIGTYPDGVMRATHVATESIEEFVARRLTGFLPFASVVVHPCANIVTCQHGIGAR